MDKIPLPYITNLDNKYNTIILKIEANIKNFNTYVYNFVQKIYIKPSKNDNQSCSEETNTNGTCDNKEKSALVIFNYIQDLYKDIINTESEGSQPIKNLNDLSRNDLSENDLSENDLSRNDLSENDLSRNDLSRNDLSRNDLSENDLSRNDLSRNDLSRNDLSGNNIHIENDTSGGNEEYIENDASGGNEENQPKKITIKQYEIPELVFPTKKKIIRKYYKKLIVKLHPDKIDSENTVKFQKYFSECKKAKKLNCLYKCWLLSKKIGIKVKKTENITKAFLKEINILKVYIEERENSIINKWINSNNNDEKDLLIIQYITTFL